MIKPLPKIYPVVHHTNSQTTMDEAKLAFECGADGVFLISHDGYDETIVNLAYLLHHEYPHKDIGVNLLSTSLDAALSKVKHHRIKMLWLDNCGINSDNKLCNFTKLQKIKDFLEETKSIQIFGGVAFKYQDHEADPFAAAYVANQIGLVPTTSGSGTGSAPELQKIIDMSIASEGNLAIASGMTPDNIEEFAPYLSHILVATGVSKDMYHFDYEKLSVFIAKVRNLK